MLRTLGGNLCEFTENLDALHSFLSLSYKVSVSVLLLWSHSLNSLCAGAGNERTVLPGGEGPRRRSAPPLLLGPQGPLPHCSRYS